MMQNEIFELLRFEEDAVFDDLYPVHIQNLSQLHWTPLNIAKQAAAFLAESNAKILDIGSGVGKFCIIAGYYNPQARFYGIEQRRELTLVAELAKKELNLSNIDFIHGNLTDLNFEAYDHFYFFNSFYENLKPENGIDQKIKTTKELYNYYTRFLFQQLDQKPSGTKLVTYHGARKQIPQSYQLVENSCHYALKFWIKD